MRIEGFSLILTLPVKVDTSCALMQNVSSRIVALASFQQIH